MAGHCPQSPALDSFGPTALPHALSVALCDKYCESVAVKHANAHNTMLSFLFLQSSSWEDTHSGFDLEFKYKIGLLKSLLLVHELLSLGQCLGCKHIEHAAACSIDFDSGRGHGDQDV
eukprot:2092937-Amphidinium_carterae.1